MYTNADITLYHYENGIYTREVIKDVFWDEIKSSNVSKTGITNADSIKIFIPLSSKAELDITLAKDIIIKGTILTEIDNTSQATQSSSLTSLKSEYGFVTVSSCDKKLYGSIEMQHYMLSCK